MKIAISILLSLFLISCSTTSDIDTSTVAGKYELAEAYEKNERFQEAIIKFTDIKNQHPYSRFAAMSELKIADIHFKREAWSESKLAYQIFQDYHPSYRKLDYIIFQIGMATFKSLPEDIDRDLSEAKDALASFETLLRRFPDSKYNVEARKMRASILRKLAEKEIYIADFYLKKEKYVSALRRYKKVLTDFPNIGLTPKALFGASISAFEADKADQGKTYLNRLFKSYPNTQEAANLKVAAGKYGIR